MATPRYKESALSRVFDAFNIFLMLIMAFTVVYPFVNLLAISLNDGIDAVMGGIYLFPRKFTFQSYQFVAENPKLLRGTIISIARVIVGTSTTVLVTGLLSYITTIRGFSGRRFMRILFVITMYFSGGLIPTYLLMLRLNLVNSFAVYWVPSLISAYYMLLMSSYIQSIPESLGESARIDGASELLIYFRIIIPVSIPVFAAVAVYVAVGQWNAWFDTALYNPNRQWDTLQIILRRLLLEVEALKDIQESEALGRKYSELTPQTVKAATTILVTLPIVFVYPFFQRYFIGGLTLGGIKG